MMPVLKLEDYKIFNRLAFQEKLRFWDDKNLNFENTYEIIEDDLTIDLNCSNISELVQYNKWVVEHYQKDLSTGIFNRKGSTAIGSRYINFQSRKEDYERQICKQDLLKTQEFINKQKSVIDKFLKNYDFSKDSFSLVKDAIKYSSEEELYTVIHSMKMLKGIATLVDIVKYWYFLREKELELKATRITQIPYSYKITIEIMTELYYVLVERSFIHHNTELGDFLNVFIKDDSSISKIRWIDTVGMNSKEIRILSLTMFMEAFFDDVEMQTQFIIKHFVINGFDMYGNLNLEFATPTRKQLRNARWTSSKSIRVLEMDEIVRAIRALPILSR